MIMRIVAVKIKYTDPFGYSSELFPDQPIKVTKADTKLLERRAWDIALAPLKSLPMNAFMLYMSGNSIQIFSILVTGMLIMNNFKALFALSTAFGPNSNVSQKIMYVVSHCVLLALGVYKCASMGILPISREDWVSYDEPEQLALLLM